MIQIDSTDSGQIYLSKDSLNAEITTAKCSAININLPGQEDGVFDEQPVPEMFKTVVHDGKLVTTFVEHSGWLKVDPQCSALEGRMVGWLSWNWLWINIYTTVRPMSIDIVRLSIWEGICFWKYHWLTSKASELLVIFGLSSNHHAIRFRMLLDKNDSFAIDRVIGKHCPWHRQEASDWQIWGSSGLILGRGSLKRFPRNVYSF